MEHWRSQIASLIRSGTLSEVCEVEVRDLDVDAARS